MIFFSLKNLIRLFNFNCITYGAVLSSGGHVVTNLGQFENLHNIAIDSKGNIYTAEVQGKRIQRFLNMSGL